jgi:hypothetical protein
MTMTMHEHGGSRTTSPALVHATTLKSDEPHNEIILSSFHAGVEV